MQKNSKIKWELSALLGAAIIGGAWFLLAARDTPPPQPEPTTTWQTLTPGPNPPSGNAKSVPDVSAATSPLRGSTIIRCTDPEVGEFFTNATTCDAADLSNRLSYSAPLATTPNRDKYSGQDYVPPAQQAANSRADDTFKPNLRSQAKSPPDGLNVSCKFSVGMALKLERNLSAADDPKKSIWREDYCKWRCEALQKNCPVADSYFYYRHREICGFYYLNQC
jgi:hypothetical protein